MSARAVSSGTIAFGLISVPFKLYTAQSSQRVAFNTLHRSCGCRTLGHPSRAVCPVDDIDVDRADTVRGFEYARDQYVRFTNEELATLEAARTGVFEILEFVPADTVDALYVKTTHFVGPDQNADRAYRLLALTLERRRLVAVGRFASRGKRKLMLLRPHRGGLVVHECYYANEVRSFDEVESDDTFDFKPIELELAGKLVDQCLGERFDPARYRDEWADRVRDAVEHKIACGESVPASETPGAQVIDMLDALKRSAATADVPRRVHTTPLTRACTRKE